MTKHREIIMTDAQRIEELEKRVKDLEDQKGFVPAYPNPYYPWQPPIVPWNIPSLQSKPYTDC